jgi:hypothetical protein
MPESSAGRAGRPPSPERGPGTPSGDPDDEVLAAVLIRMWALASGRVLRRDVPPGRLSEEELITFWADDMSGAAGRHARPAHVNAFPETGDLDAASHPAAKPRRRKGQRSGGKAADTQREPRADTTAA